MKMFHNENTDYIEIFKESGVPNYGEDGTLDVTVFRSEETNEIIGYGFHFEDIKESKWQKELD